MSQDTASSSNEEKRRSIKGLLTWLVLIPLILGTLICCGQMALFFMQNDQGGYTSSLLAADYRPWPYEKIPPINVEAFMKDVQAEEGTVIVGDYWVFPSPSTTVFPIAQATIPPTATDPPAAPTSVPPSPTRLVTLTPNIPTSTLQPSSTPLPTLTRAVFIPSSTQAPPPANPTATFTLAPPPATITFTPTFTQTFTPMPTDTFTFTPTTETPLITPTFTPTYAPVRPIAENDGAADQMDNGGCRAYFGYRNDNPSEVDILVGPQNNLNDQAAIDNPPQPIQFMVGRVFGAFEFTWYSGLSLIWTLDGRTATANWCYP